MVRVRNLLLLSLVFAGFFHSAATAIGGMYERDLNVFTFGVVKRWGGVILQGTTEFYDEKGRAISPNELELRMNKQSDESQEVCIVFEGTCYQIDLSPDVAIPLAKWVLSGQTGAYTNVDPNQNELENSEGVLRPVYMGFAPIDLAQEPIPNILAFIDFDNRFVEKSLLLNSLDEVLVQQTKDKYNRRLGSNFAPEEHYLIRSDSWINTDTDTNFVTRLANRQAQSEGLISRYRWAEYEGAEYPYVTEVEQACSPESVKAYDVENCSGLKNYGYSVDSYGYSFDSVGFEPGEYIAFYLSVETTVDSFVTKQPQIRKSKSENIFLSLPNANDEKFNHVSLSSKENGDLLLEWEDLLGGGDKDFNDLVIRISKASNQESSQLETLDTNTGIIPASKEGTVTGVFQISGQAGQIVYPDFQVVDKDAAYISEFGFFKVDDAEGSIDGLKPTHPDYMKAALSRSRPLLANVGLRLYQPQKEAIVFVRTAAIFRRFADDNPRELERLIEDSRS